MWRRDSKTTYELPICQKNKEGPRKVRHQKREAAKIVKIRTANAERVKWKKNTHCESCTAIISVKGKSTFAKIIRCSEIDRY